MVENCVVCVNKLPFMFLIWLRLFIDDFLDQYLCVLIIISLYVTAQYWVAAGGFVLVYAILPDEVYVSIIGTNQKLPMREGWDVFYRWHFHFHQLPPSPTHHCHSFPPFNKGRCKSITVREIITVLISMFKCSVIYIHHITYYNFLVYNFNTC